MKIKVSDIGNDGLSLNLSKEPSWLVNAPDIVSGEGGNRISSDFDVRLHVSKVLNEIHVEGQIGFSIVSPCARCLDRVESNLKPEINLTLLPYRPETEENEIGDYESYDGNEIDLSGYLREIITISLPVKVLCSEECRGLCQNCGVNLNLATCSCEDDGWIDPKLAALRNVKL
jgi:uncharacterized protein